MRYDKLWSSWSYIVFTVQGIKLWWNYVQGLLIYQVLQWLMLSMQAVLLLWGFREKIHGTRVVLLVDAEERAACIDMYSGGWLDHFHHGNNSVLSTFIRRICIMLQVLSNLGCHECLMWCFCNAPDRFHQWSDQFHRQPGRAGYSKATLAYWLILCSFEYVMHSRKRLPYAFIFYIIIFLSSGMTIWEIIPSLWACSGAAGGGASLSTNVRFTMLYPLYRYGHRLVSCSAKCHLQVSSKKLFYLQRVVCEEPQNHSQFIRLGVA